MKRKSENALTNNIVRGKKKHEKIVNQKVIHQNKRVNELS